MHSAKGYKVYSILNFVVAHLTEFSFSWDVWMAVYFFFYHEFASWVEKHVYLAGLGPTLDTIDFQGMFRGAFDY